jgi:hypothetical protein
VVTLKGIAGIYDAADGFSNVMAGIVATIHVLFSCFIRLDTRGYPDQGAGRSPCAVRNINCGSA